MPKYLCVQQPLFWEPLSFQGAGQHSHRQQTECELLLLLVLGCLPACCRYERGLGDGLQQDFRVLQADAVTAGSRAPTPPQTSHGHRASPEP